MVFLALLLVAIWFPDWFVSNVAWAPAKSDPRLCRAASGAPCRSHWAPIGEEDKTKKLEVESAKLIEYRYVYPSHAPPGRLVFTQQNLPPKGEQRAWHVYEKGGSSIRQQWVCLPTLNEVSQPTGILAGAPKEASLFACKPWLQDWHEHWTNIWRMWFLAGRRPQVQNVRQIWHKGEKALDPIPLQLVWTCRKPPPGPLRLGHSNRTLWRGDVRRRHDAWDQ